MLSAQDLVNMGFQGYTGWGDPEAWYDYLATSGKGKEGSGLQQEISGGQTAPFTFDWEQAERDALEKLRPYYEQILSEAKGDVERAKGIIEQDYSLGRRYREEDISAERADLGLTEPKERERLLEDLNRRGLFVPEQYKSSIQETETGELTSRQQARREAVERATQRRGELAGIERQRGTQELDIQFPRRQRELEEEKKLKAAEMAQTKYGRDQAKFLAETSRYLS